MRNNQSMLLRNYSVCSKRAQVKWRWSYDDDDDHYHDDHGKDPFLNFPIKAEESKGDKNLHRDNYNQAQLQLQCFTEFYKVDDYENPPTSCHLIFSPHAPFCKTLWNFHNVNMQVSMHLNWKLLANLTISEMFGEKKLFLPLKL